MTIASHLGMPVVRIEPQALVQAAGVALGALPNETGGVVVGWWEDDDTAVVCRLVPVPDAHSGRTSYLRHHASAQRALDAELQMGLDAYAGYIGEWHSHPAPQPPSAIDRATLGAIVRQVRRPVVLVVLAVDQECEVVVHGLIGRPRWPRRFAIEPARVEGKDT